MQQTLADKTHWFTFIAASLLQLKVVECWKDSVTILLFDAEDDLRIIAVKPLTNRGDSPHCSCRTCFWKFHRKPFTRDYRTINPQTVISRNVMMNEGVCVSVTVDGTTMPWFHNRWNWIIMKSRHTAAYISVTLLYLYTVVTKPNTVLSCFLH